MRNYMKTYYEKNPKQKEKHRKFMKEYKRKKYIKKGD